MKKKLIPIILLLIANTINAQNVMHEESPVIKLQNPQPIIGKVFYNYYAPKDNRTYNKSEPEQMVLSFSQTESDFSSYSLYLNDSIRRINMENYINTNQSLIGYKSTYKRSTREKYYNKEDKIIEIRPFLEVFYLININDSLQWDILDSTKQLKGYTVQKAHSNNPGTQYTAWFTTDLPYSFGPQKLHGLPGLILEAYDDKKERIYALDSIQMHPAPSVIGIPVKSEYTTLEKYKKWQKLIVKIMEKGQLKSNEEAIKKLKKHTNLK